MYEIDNETESLIRSTEFSIERRGARTLKFLLHETIAPAVDDKYAVSYTHLTLPTICSV